MREGDGRSNGAAQAPHLKERYTERVRRHHPRPPAGRGLATSVGSCLVNIDLSIARDRGVWPKVPVFGVRARPNPKNAHKTTTRAATGPRTPPSSWTTAAAALISTPRPRLSEWRRGAPPPTTCARYIGQHCWPRGNRLWHLRRTSSLTRHRRVVANHPVTKSDQRPAQADPQCRPRPPACAQLFRRTHRVRQPFLGQPQRDLLMKIHHAHPPNDRPPTPSHPRAASRTIPNPPHAARPARH